MTVKCLQGLNIFVITELVIATLFARVLVMKHQMTCCRFLCFSIGLVTFWKIIEPPAALLSHIKHSSAVPVEFHIYDAIVTGVARRLQVPTICSKDICFRPRGISWSSPLRSVGSRDDQVGGLVWQSHSSVGPRVWKLGLQDCLTATPRQPDRWRVGWIKGLLSWNMY